MSGVALDEHRGIVMVCCCSAPPKRDVGIRGTLRYEHGVAVERAPQPKVTRSIDTFSEVSLPCVGRSFVNFPCVGWVSVVTAVVCVIFWVRLGFTFAFPSPAYAHRCYKAES